MTEFNYNVIVFLGHLKLWWKEAVNLFTFSEHIIYTKRRINLCNCNKLSSGVRPRAIAEFDSYWRYFFILIVRLPQILTACLITAGNKQCGQKHGEMFLLQGPTSGPSWIWTQLQTAVPGLQATNYSATQAKLLHSKPVRDQFREAREITAREFAQTPLQWSSLFRGRENQSNWLVHCAKICRPRYSKCGFTTKAVIHFMMTEEEEKKLIRKYIPVF